MTDSIRGSGLLRDVVELGPGSGGAIPSRSQATAALVETVFGRLRAAGLLARPDARLDGLVPTPGGAASPSPRTNRQALAALVTDVDGDEQLDLEPALLAATGLLRHDATMDTVTQALVAPEVGLDRFDFLGKCSRAPTRERLVGLAPPVALRAQRTIDRAALARGTTARAAAAHERLTLALPLVRGADGRVTAFAGELPPGATLLSTAELGLRPAGRATKAAYFLTLLDEEGRAVVDTRLSARFVPADPALAPDLTRAVLRELAAAHARGAEEAPRLTRYLAGIAALEVTERAAAVTSPRLATTRQELEREYGTAPLRWLGYITSPRRARLVDAVLGAALPEHGISASFLYTVAIGEGLNAWVASAPGLDAPVDGFEHLGVDTFGSKVERLKRKGLIPAHWRAGRHFTRTTHVNELGEVVTSASFPRVRDGLVALAGMLAEYRQFFLADAVEILGAETTARLTPEQVGFFTYLYFNAGEGAGRRKLLRHGLAAAEPWRGPRPPDNRVARFNSLQRVATWQMLERLGVF